MEVTTINAELFARMFLAGAKNLEAKKSSKWKWISVVLGVGVLGGAYHIHCLDDPLTYAKRHSQRANRRGPFSHSRSITKCLNSVLLPFSVDV